MSPKIRLRNCVDVCRSCGGFAPYEPTGIVTQTAEGITVRYRCHAGHTWQCWWSKVAF